jgi:hypothetical protein
MIVRPADEACGNILILFASSLEFEGRQIKPIKTTLIRFGTALILNVSLSARSGFFSGSSID